MKKIKKLASDEELRKITDRLPENREVCKSILEMLDNRDVVIENDENNTTSLYLVMQNKIVIGNMKCSFVRIQTIAHECIHSVQNKKILKFNYIFSNIYLLYFMIITICAILNFPNNITAKSILLIILIVLSFIYLIVRGLLEVDAITRAPFLARRYMEDVGVLDNKEVELICKNYKELNKIGIPMYVIILAIKIIVKMLIYWIVVS